MTGLEKLAMCLGLRGLDSFRGGRGHVVCVCVPGGFGGLLEGFVKFREYGDVAYFCRGSLSCM